MWARLVLAIKALLAAFNIGRAVQRKLDGVEPTVSGAPGIPKEEIDNAGRGT